MRNLTDDDRHGDAQASSFEDLLTKAFERTNALQTYWTLDATVVLAVVAFFAKVEGGDTCLLAVLITIAFTGFVVANLGALRDVSKQRAVTQQLLKQAAAASDPSQLAARLSLAGTINPATTTQVTILHLAGDAFAISALWLLALT